ncbi:MAG: trypsin-like peptidase domain-containing protein [Planctomycetaceae bacterium]|nr:trypsin-like peptidase domain-containing protein [Planctomycetaceae bacterium]
MAIVSFVFAFAAFTGFTSGQNVAAQNVVPQPPANAGSVVMLEFVTANCTHCRQIEPLVGELLSQGYPIRQLDASQHPQLVRQFGIQSYPTLLVLVGTTEVDRVTGGGDPVVMRPRILRMFETAQEFIAKNNQRPSSAIPVATSLAAIPTTAVAPNQHNVTQPVTQLAQIQPTATVASTSTANATTASVKTFDAAACRRSSVRIKVDDATGHSWGTGTIVDARSGYALVLTCAHIFRETCGKGAIVEVHLFNDQSQTEVKTQGRCIRSDLEIDVALLVIKPPCAVEARPILSEHQAVSIGNAVYSVGCDGGAAPTVWEHRILSLDRIGTPRTNAEPFHYIQVSGAPVSGRSGGGLFTSDGYLIGVCNTADPDTNDGHFVPPHVIRRELDKENLTAVHQNPSLHDTQTIVALQPSNIQPPTASQFSPQQSQTQQQPSQQPQLQQSSQPTPDSIMRPIQQNNQPNQPMLNRQSGTEVAARVGEMSETEHATLEEVNRHRKNGDEVILIVLSKQDKENKSEIVRLQNVSGEFLQQVSKNTSPEPTTVSAPTQTPQPPSIRWTPRGQREPGGRPPRRGPHARSQP